MGGIQSTHEAPMTQPTLADTILPEHQEECTTMGDALETCGKALKVAKTYQEVKTALDTMAHVADSIPPTGLLEVVHTGSTVEDEKHSGPTGSEGQE